jgi:hypothetical protein
MTRRPRLPRATLADEHLDCREVVQIVDQLRRPSPEAGIVPKRRDRLGTMLFLEPPERREEERIGERAQFVDGSKIIHRRTSDMKRPRVAATSSGEHPSRSNIAT